MSNGKEQKRGGKGKAIKDAKKEGKAISEKTAEKPSSKTDGKKEAFGGKQAPPFEGPGSDQAHPFLLREGRDDADI